MSERAEVDEVRYARGRRPFLCKKSSGSFPRDDEEGNQSDDHDWWSEKSARVTDWLRSNPLHLGMDDDSVQLVKSMLKKGAAAKGEKKRTKCWAHICIEMADVPASPISSDEIQDTDKLVKDAEKPSTRPASPEEEDEGDDNDAGSRSVTLPKRISSFSVAGNNDEATPRMVSGRNIAEEKKLEETTKLEQKESDSLANLAMESEQKENEAEEKGDHELVMAEKPPLLRRKTDSDINSSTSSLFSAAAEENIFTPASALTKRLTSMSLIERQEYMLKKREEKNQIQRALQKEKEVEGCTHKPSVFTRRNTFSNIESVVKKHTSPKKSSSKSRLVTQEPKQQTKPSESTSFLDECKNLMEKSRTGEYSEQDDGKSSSGKSKRGRRNSLTRRKSKTKLLEQNLASSELLSACRDDLEKERERREAELAEQRQKEEEEAQKLEQQRLEEEKRREQARIAAEAAAEAKRKSAKHYSFAENSTTTKGKIQLQDVHHFQLDSFYRKRDRGSSKPGVSLLMGKREDDFTEQVVAVVFDRNKFTEEEAATWMDRNVHRFPIGKRK